MLACHRPFQVWRAGRPAGLFGSPGPGRRACHRQAISTRAGGRVIRCAVTCWRPGLTITATCHGLCVGPERGRTPVWSNPHTGMTRPRIRVAVSSDLRLPPPAPAAALSPPTPETSSRRPPRRPWLQQSTRLRLFPLPSHRVSQKTGPACWLRLSGSLSWWDKEADSDPADLAAPREAGLGKSAPHACPSRGGEAPQTRT